MKKSVLSILTFCFVFIGVLAFSCPVFARTKLSTYNSDLSSSNTVSSYVDVKFYKGNVYATGPSTSNSQYGVSNFYYLSDSVSFDVTVQYNLKDHFSGNDGNDIVAPLNADSFTSYIRSSASVDFLTSNTFGFALGSITGATFNINSVLLDVSPPSDSWTILSGPIYGRPVFSIFSVTYHVFLSNLTSSSDSLEKGFTQTLRINSSISYFDFTFFSENQSDLSNQTNSINNTIHNETIQQTDQLSNGYDNSSMTDDNTRLNSQIDQYDQAQEETTNKSTAYIDGAEFVNPFSNATVLASVTFATSFLQSLFMNLDIWQLVVTVSLCLVLALMLVGWFKFRGD